MDAAARRARLDASLQHRQRHQMVATTALQRRSSDDMIDKGGEERTRFADPALMRRQGYRGQFSVIAIGVVERAEFFLLRDDTACAVGAPFKAGRCPIALPSSLIVHPYSAVKVDQGGDIAVAGIHTP